MCYTNNKSNMVISRVLFFNKFGFIIGARNLNLSFPLSECTKMDRIHQSGPKMDRIGLK